MWVAAHLQHALQIAAGRCMPLYKMNYTYISGISNDDDQINDRASKWTIKISLII
jgi:hypothetical protein